MTTTCLQSDCLQYIIYPSESVDLSAVGLSATYYISIRICRLVCTRIVYTVLYIIHNLSTCLQSDCLQYSIYHSESVDLSAVGLSCNILYIIQNLSTCLQSDRLQHIIYPSASVDLSAVGLSTPSYILVSFIICRLVCSRIVYTVI